MNKNAKDNKNNVKEEPKDPLETCINNHINKSETKINVEVLEVYYNTPENILNRVNDLSYYEKKDKEKTDTFSLEIENSKTKSTVKTSLLKKENKEKEISEKQNNILLLNIIKLQYHYSLNKETPNYSLNTNELINRLLILNHSKYFAELINSRINPTNKSLCLLYKAGQKRLPELISKNPGGLYLVLIKSIIFQLLKAVEFLNKNKFAHLNIRTENIFFNLSRVKCNMIGFSDDLLYLSSNVNLMQNEVHLAIKLGDNSKVKTFVQIKPPEITDPKEKEKRKKEALAQAAKKKPPPVKSNPKNDKDKGKKGEPEPDHILVQELKQNDLYYFNAFNSPEIMVKNLLKSYIFEDEDNPSPLPGSEADIWSIGCVMAELIDGNKLFPLATNDYDCLFYINKLVGLSAEQKNLFTANGFNLEKENFNCLFVNEANNSKVDLSLDLKNRYLGKASKNVIDLLSKMLEPDPKKRITIEEIFKHSFLAPFFETDNVFEEYKKNGVVLIEGKHTEKIMRESEFKKLDEAEQKLLTLKNIILAKEVMKFSNK